MIRVPLTVIVFFYLFAFLIVVFSVWLLDERRRRRARPACVAISVALRDMWV